MGSAEISSSGRTITFEFTDNESKTSIFKKGSLVNVSISEDQKVVTLIFSSPLSIMKLSYHAYSDRNSLVIDKVNDVVPTSNADLCDKLQNFIT